VEGGYREAEPEKDRITEGRGSEAKAKRRANWPLSFMYDRGMNDFDLGWVCGFLEGEGSFSISRYQHRMVRNGVETYYPDALMLVRVTHTDRDVLERLLQLTGIGTVKSKKNYSPISKKDQWEWRVQRRPELRCFLPLVRDHLSPRRQSKIDEIMGFLASTIRG